MNAGYIEAHLARRRDVAGRSVRQKLEKDCVTILSGLAQGATTGKPVALLIPNAVRQETQPCYVPRPGHADLAGAVKYGHQDMNGVSERASARETAMTVALSCFTRKLLEEAGVTVTSRTLSIGKLTDPVHFHPSSAALLALVEASPLRCATKAVERKMLLAIEKARTEGDTLGGVFEINLSGLPCGLGSHTQWDRKLKAKLAESLMSLNGITGVELEDGFDATALRGSEFNGSYEYQPQSGKIMHCNARLRSIAGGISTGAPIILRAAMKPLSTLGKPAASLDMRTYSPKKAPAFRSDICAVAAAAVVAESLVATAAANALLEKFGGDSMKELLPRIESWRTSCRLLP